VVDYPSPIRLILGTRVFEPALCIFHAFLWVKISRLFANFYRLAARTILGHNKFDEAMAVLVVIPIKKRGNPLAILFFTLWANGRMDIRNLKILWSGRLAIFKTLQKLLDRSCNKLNKMII
jgi:hypothetical protein